MSSRGSALPGATLAEGLVERVDPDRVPAPELARAAEGPEGRSTQLRSTLRNDPSPSSHAEGVAAVVSQDLQHRCRGRLCGCEKDLPARLLAHRSGSRESASWTQHMCLASTRRLSWAQGAPSLSQNAASRTLHEGRLRPRPRRRRREAGPGLEGPAGARASLASARRGPRAAADLRRFIAGPQSPSRAP